MSLKNHSKTMFRHSFHLCILFSENDGWCGKICKWKRLPKLNNKMSFIYFKICSGTIKSFPNHFDQFAFCVYIYIRLVFRIWMHSNISYFFWDNKFDILCHEIIPSANSQGITIKLKLFQNELELIYNSISLSSVHQYWPAHPDNPSGIRGTSVIESSVGGFLCCLFAVLLKFSNTIS